MDTLPIWCDGCNQESEIIVNSYEYPVFVVCQNCNAETANVWCPKCQMGGQFIRNIEEKPTKWRCAECNTIYELPEDFYARKIYLPNNRSFDTFAPAPQNKQFYLTQKDIFEVSSFLFFILVIFLLSFPPDIYMQMGIGWSVIALFAFLLRFIRFV